jgi:hypothetical protein
MTKNSPHAYAMKYVQYEPVCPKCGKFGCVYAQYTQIVRTGHWCGPYYSVVHITRTYDPEKYHRKKGVGAVTRGRIAYRCYFGKVYPKSILRIVPP